MTLLDKAVTQAEDDTWTFQCPGVQGDPCGDPPFSSNRWPTKKAATARGAQHFDAHKVKAPMQEMGAFLRDQGLTVNDDGSVSVKDL